MAWLSSGRLTNPLLDQVLVDTGAMSAGSYFFDAFAASSVASIFEVQLRDAANTATLKSQIIAVQATSSTWGFEIPSSTYLDVAVNQRIRMIQVAPVTGQVSVSLVGNF